MHAMILKSIGSLSKNPAPLEWSEQPDPVAKTNEVLIRVKACGVCHTELDEIEGRTPPPQLPVILGHQVVGRVELAGTDVKGLEPGDRVGVAWIYSACGKCQYCNRGEENLCPNFLATGRDRNGGYAELMSVPAAYCYPIPDQFTDTQAAPLLCAGAVGYRSLQLADLQNRFPDTKIYVFARDEKEQVFARDLGAAWAGSSMEQAPERLHAIIDTTPAWTPILGALENLEPGGRLVINAIRKEGGDQNALMDLDYPRHLWMEKEIKSVANVTGNDVREFLELAADIPLQPEVQEYQLKEANQALLDMKNKHIRGAKVLLIG